MIDRLPAHAAHLPGFEHGCLVRLDQGDGRTGPVLEFAFNPETITRARTGRWDPRRARRPADAVVAPSTARGDVAAHGAAALLAEAETISFRLTLDATETILRGTDPTEASPAAVGILPELAFLEQVSIGRDVQENRGGAGTRAGRTGGTPIRPVRPDELLLELGSSRAFPCVLTELSITEQKFTAGLVPVRAEAELKLTVLEPVENPYNPLVRRAFDQLLAERTRHADLLGGSAGAGSLRAAVDGTATGGTAGVVV
ncbi:hypothetical protein [Cellulomonas sp. KH9]|uniref:hypothetical protein n=1 Tax=Cellulomonas sp. KH9 TaxID=1855324 RepID=UPI0008EC0E2E|nr:hypothetical protein [Cellulomonas sp. KH9]SFK01477.1 hypothetical protein SAMN05216467_1709 [Cellulomonas sp. KH9]